jgi:hypothetical protein
MKGLKIRVFKDGSTQPDTTLTIPIAILRFAKKLMPKQVAGMLQDHGIDLDQIVELSQQEDVQGTIVEIERHRKKEKVIISVE